MLAFCSLFAFEREADQALVIAAGLAHEWLVDGFEIAVKDLPTYYGKLSYTLRHAGGAALRLLISGDLAVPPGGLVVRPPLHHPLVSVQVDGKSIETFDAASVTLRACPADVVMSYGGKA
jgi:hypothetical protein